MYDETSFLGSLSLTLIRSRPDWTLILFNPIRDFQLWGREST